MSATAGASPSPISAPFSTGRAAASPTILLTGYYGSFDLLPTFLAYNGIRATAVYLPVVTSRSPRVCPGTTAQGPAGN